jgi:hypothetical protein
MKAIVGNILVGGIQVEVLQCEDNSQWVSVPQLVSLGFADCIDDFGHPASKYLQNCSPIELEVGLSSRKVLCITLQDFGYLVLKLAASADFSNSSAAEMARDLIGGNIQAQ